LTVYSRLQKGHLVDSFGATLRALRESAGLSLYALARRITWSKAAIGHVETGTRPPSPEIAAALDKALGAGGVLIALAASERETRRTVEDVKRRELLKGLAGAALTPLPAGRIADADVVPLVTRLAYLRSLDDALGGADTFDLYLAEVKQTRAALASTTHSGATRQALLAVLSEQAQLAGWAAFDAGWLDKSEDLYATSRTAALDADNPGLYANALALDAYQRAFSGQPDTNLATASCDALTERVPARVRALVYDRAAWTYAVAGMTAATESSLGRAADAIDVTTGPPSPDWAAWVDPLELDIMTGRCWAALQRPLRAVVPLERALTTFPDAYARDKALYLLALAEGYLHGAEVELAAQTIAKAHELTKGVASTRPAVRLRHTLTVAAKYADARPLRDFRAALTEAGATPQQSSPTPHRPRTQRRPPLQ
jgi:transcriptional regulator with XRE-family HTH domain